MASHSGIIQRGRAICEEVHHQLISSHSVLDQNKLLNGKNWTQIDAYRTFGEPYLRLTAHTIHVDEARRSCQMACQKLHGREIRSLVGLATGMSGSGNCFEMAQKVVFRSMQSGEQGVIIACTDDAGSSINSHAFVLLSPNEIAIEENSEPLAALKASTAIVVDPFFNLVCPSAELSGTPFEAYFRQNNITRILTVDQIPVADKEFLDEINENAKEIHELAKRLLKSKDWICDQKTVVNLNFLSTIRFAQVIEQTPDIEWRKPNRGLPSIWTRGSEEEMRALSERLEKHFDVKLTPRKEKNGSEYVLFIDKEALLRMKKAD